MNSEESKGMEVHNTSGKKITQKVLWPEIKLNLYINLVQEKFSCCNSWFIADKLKLCRCVTAERSGGQQKHQIKGTL